MIQNYDEFITELHRAGFSLGGGSSKGIYAAVPFDWTEQPAGTQVRWHTGEPDTDPWEWRILEERSDIAYAKVFFRGSGYITREWYPFFMSVRRRGMTFEEMWESGRVTELSRRIYEAVRDNGRVAMHDIKRLAGLSGETSAHIEKAMTDLQMSMLLTKYCDFSSACHKDVCSVNTRRFASVTPEEFWHTEDTGDIPPEEAAERIRARVLELNPDAQERKIRKFIYG